MNRECECEGCGAPADALYDRDLGRLCRDCDVTVQMTEIMIQDLIADGATHYPPLELGPVRGFGVHLVPLDLRYPNAAALLLAAANLRVRRAVRTTHPPPITPSDSKPSG